VSNESLADVGLVAELVTEAAPEPAIEPVAESALAPIGEFVVAASIAEPVAEPVIDAFDEAAPEPILNSFDALPILDATCLDAASMGNVEIRGLLVDAFLTRTRQPLDRLKKAAEWNDVRALEIQAHAMRGMCQSVGAVRCAAALGQVEELASAGRLDDALVALERIDGELAAVRAEWDVAKGEGGSVARAA
jgi:HPt (histidine-containing phosphotransfer) domain-containing protein